MVAFAPLDVTSYPAWSLFWRDAVGILRRCGYTTPTLRLYRQVLRSFARFCGKPPGEIVGGDLQQFLLSLSIKPCTWHWMGMNVSILRVLFDKIGRLGMLDRQRGPRRTRPVPRALERADIARLLDAAPTLRDQVVVALLYGCGLRTGELRNLTWADVDPARGVLVLANRFRGTLRTLRLPTGLVPLLEIGKARCEPGQYVIPGARADKPCSARMIQRSITACVRAAVRRGAVTLDGLPVTPMTLRHSYAVHFLEDGGTLRHLQEVLGHVGLETTLRYERVVPSKRNGTKPVDLLMHPAWKTLAQPLFPLIQQPPSFREILKARLSGGLLALRRWWTG